MKNFKNFLLVTPDLLSSSSLGLLLAPVFLFITFEGIITSIVVLIFYIFYDSYLLEDGKFYFYVSVVLLIFPVLLITKKSFFFSKVYLYIYLIAIWLSLALDFLNIKHYLSFLDNQHTYYDFRFAGYSLEPSFFAETFFPILLIVLNENNRKLKNLYLFSLCIFFYFSLSRTLAQNIIIYFLAASVLIIFSKFNYKKVVITSYIFLVFSFLIFFKNFNILDEAIEFTLSGLNSWRTVSNISAMICSKIISIPTNFNYDSFAAVALDRFGMDGINAIFSAFPFMTYAWGSLIAVGWSFFILWYALPNNNNLNRVSSIFALIIIYFFISPKWNFVVLYAILYLKHMKS
jgi:hypothetical protein